MSPTEGGKFLAIKGGGSRTFHGQERTHRNNRSKVSRIAHWGKNTGIIHECTQQFIRLS